MSYQPKIESETHYVLDIRVQEVVVTTVKSEFSNIANSGVKTETRRDVGEVAHYVVSEKILQVALDKGTKLLELTGDQP